MQRRCEVRPQYDATGSQTHTRLPLPPLSALYFPLSVCMSRPQPQSFSDTYSSANLVLKCSIPSRLLVTNITSETKSRWLATQPMPIDTPLNPACDTRRRNTFPVIPCGYILHLTNITASAKLSTLHTPIRYCDDVRVDYVPSTSIRQNSPSSLVQYDTKPGAVGGVDV